MGLHLFNERTFQIEHSENLALDKEGGAIWGSELSEQICKEEMKFSFTSVVKDLKACGSELRSGTWSRRARARLSLQ